MKTYIKMFESIEDDFDDDITSPEEEEVQSLLARTITAIANKDKIEKLTWLLDALYSVLIKMERPEVTHEIVDSLLAFTHRPGFEEQYSLVKKMFKNSWSQIEEPDPSTFSPKELDNAINAAIDKNDWETVKKLSKFLPESLKNKIDMILNENLRPLEELQGEHDDLIYMKQSNLLGGDALKALARQTIEDQLVNVLDRMKSAVDSNDSAAFYETLKYYILLNNFAFAQSKNPDLARIVTPVNSTYPTFVKISEFIATKVIGSEHEGWLSSPTAVEISKMLKNS